MLTHASTFTQKSDVAKPAVKNHWTVDDEKELIEGLIEFRAEGNGKGQFKLKTFRKIVPRLNKMLTLGTLKTEKT